MLAIGDHLGKTLDEIGQMTVTDFALTCAFYAARMKR